VFERFQFQIYLGLIPVPACTLQAQIIPKQSLNRINHHAHKPSNNDRKLLHQTRAYKQSDHTKAHKENAFFKHPAKRSEIQHGNCKEFLVGSKNVRPDIRVSRLCLENI